MLTSKSARARLAPRREPYWVQIGRGSYLGFRAGAGTWIVRHRDHDGRQQYRSLGEFEEFSEAKERADRWLAQIAHGAHRAPSRGTVHDALASYVRNLRSVGRRATLGAPGSASDLQLAEIAHLAVCGSRTCAARTSSNGETDFGAGVCLVP